MLLRETRKKSGKIACSPPYTRKALFFAFLPRKIVRFIFLGVRNDEVRKKILSGNVVQLNDVARLVTDINPLHIEALIALNRLFTIAEAWNKEDGFVPDFSDWEQDKWFPWFKYDKDAAGFVCAIANSAPTNANANFGSRLCFKSPARAAQFGKQFADLYNKVFL